MRGRPGLLAMGLLLAMALGRPAAGSGPLAKAPLAEAPLAEYRGPLGVAIRSWAPAWTAPGQLRAVYAELTANAHGAELAHLASVDLLPGYGFSHWTGRLAPGGDGRLALAPGSRIVLYMGGVDQVERVARILSHEYGHHFTFYWFSRATGRHPSDFRGTAWEQVRGLADEPRVRAGGGHAWEPAEIMSEDYRLLFGSPAARGDGPAGRAFAPENTDLPPAPDVPGLAAYWRELAGMQVGRSSASDSATPTGHPPGVHPGQPCPVQVLLHDPLYVRV